MRGILTHLKLYRSWGLLLLGSGLLWMVMYGNQQDGHERVLLVFGDVLLPPILGCCGAALWLGDRCRELWMTMRQPLWRVLLQRLSMLYGFGVASWLLVLGLAQLSGHSGVPIQLAIGVLITLLFGVALGTWLGLLLRSTLSGAIGVLVVWGLVIIFREALLTTPITTLLHPLLTFQDSMHPWWNINRPTIGGAATLLILHSCMLITHTESLLPAHASDDVV